jgi:L-amino acid N-acyltransferase YncA
MNLIRAAAEDKMLDFDIRPLEKLAWEQVRAIYLEGIATGLATFETAAPTWEEWDAAHLAQCRLGAWKSERLVGWAALSPVSRRRAYAGVAEVSVYVSGPSRQNGIGRALLAAVIEESERLGFWTLQGATFAENVASLRLQESCGFRVVGRRERIGSLNGVWHDTVLTERRSRIVGT